MNGSVYIPEQKGKQWMLFNTYRSTNLSICVFYYGRRIILSSVCFYLDVLQFELYNTGSLYKNRGRCRANVSSPLFCVKTELDWKLKGLCVITVVDSLQRVVWELEQHVLAWIICRLLWWQYVWCNPLFLCLSLEWHSEIKAQTCVYVYLYAPPLLLDLLLCLFTFLSRCLGVKQPFITHHTIMFIQACRPA